jgi:hypothetical protein
MRMRKRARARMENLVDLTTEPCAIHAMCIEATVYSAQLVHWNVDPTCIKSCIPRMRLRRRHSADGRSIEHKPSNKDFDDLIRSMFVSQRAYCDGRGTRAVQP